MSFFEELKRRNVFRVGIAYVLLGWVVLQAADFALDLTDAPNWIIQVLVIIGLAGLPIALFFAWAFELTPEGIKREADVDRSQSIVPQTGRKLDRAIIAFLVVAVALLLSDRWLHSESTHAPEPQTAAGEAPGAAPGQKSIAVLPFVNMSSDEEQEFFSDGISEEILNALAKVDALKVAGRTSSFAFKGRNEDLRAIGETLGVENILEGSVRKAGDRVRITAQLIQVDDGFHLWSETYDRELTDIFAIQDDIANRILAALKTALAVEGSSDAPTLDIVDYDKYLLGRQLMRERREAPLQRALTLFTEVNQNSPDFAPAWVERAITVMLLQDDLSSYGSIPLAESLPLARAYLDRAQELDPDSPGVLAGNGLYYDNLADRTRAIDYLQRALAINPNLTDARNWLWRGLWQMGRYQEALELNEQTRDRDPLYLPTAANLAFDYLILGMEPAMAAHLEKVRVQLATVSEETVRDAEAVLAFMRADYAGVVRTHQPNESKNDLWNWFRSFALMQLGEPEWAVQIAGGTPAEIAGLAAMGRIEESIMVAQPMVANRGGIGEYIGALVSNGRHTEAVEFFDQRWPSLPAFEAQEVVQGLQSALVLGRLVEALRASGDEARAGAFFARYGAILDEMDAEGVNNHWHTFSKAYYATLQGNADQALEQLTIFADGGHFMPPDFTRQWRSFEFLRGDPRFDELLARMTKRLNEQRAELDLPAYQESLRG